MKKYTFFSFLFMILSGSITLDAQKNDCLSFKTYFANIGYEHEHKHGNVFNIREVQLEEEIFDFVISKMESEHNNDAVKAIFLLGEIGDDRHLKQISPFLKNADSQFVLAAIEAMINISSEESARQLEEYLLSFRENEVAFRYALRGLLNINSQKSIAVLNSLLSSGKLENNTILKQVNSVIFSLERYHSSVEERERFLYQCLLSDELKQEEVGFALYQISKSKEKGYLKFLKRAARKAKRKNEKFIYENIMRVRAKLGEKKFNRKERKYIKERKLDMVSSEIKFCALKDDPDSKNNDFN